MRGHINRKPVTRMLVDGGAIVNLMPYLLYKKHGRKDDVTPQVSCNPEMLHSTLPNAGN